MDKLRFYSCKKKILLAFILSLTGEDHSSFILDTEINGELIVVKKIKANLWALVFKKFSTTLVFSSKARK